MSDAAYRPARRAAPRRPLWRAAAVLLLALGVLSPGWAGDDAADHERARQALQSGQILPLREVLKRLERSHPGKLLDVELEREDGRWIYELKLLQADGELIKIKLDARSADIIQLKRKPAR